MKERRKKPKIGKRGNLRMKKRGVVDFKAIIIHGK